MLVSTYQLARTTKTQRGKVNRATEKGMEGDMSFNELCIQWNVTGHERKKLRWYLVALRIESTLQLTYD